MLRNLRWTGVVLAGIGPITPACAASLRCPEEGGHWKYVYDELQRALSLLLNQDAATSRAVLAEVLESATRDLHSSFRCAVGVASLYRVLALAHCMDPAVERGPMRMSAFDVALRFQHLASGWLIYAYNNDADHDPAFIDDSLWPLTLQEFDEERHSVAATLAGLGGAVAPARPGVPRDFRLPGLSLAIVTICDYPPDTPLLRLATSVHRIYAARHGYDYVLWEKASSSGRPPAWGKVRAVQELLEGGRWDWVLWVDCDLYFMDLGTTLDSLLARYGSAAGGGLDPGVELLLTEDEQALNTAIFLLRRSAWSLELLRRVWGPEDSPFTNHTWWEQAAFAQELLGGNHRRFAGVAYEAGEAGPRAYPPEVRVVPQAEMNSYHPISSRLVGETWVPGRFVLSFNGAQSLSGPAVARVLHANYYDLFCRLNALLGECEALDQALFAPWLTEWAA